MQETSHQLMEVIQQKVEYSCFCSLLLLLDPAGGAGGSGGEVAAGHSGAFAGETQREVPTFILVKMD